MKKLITIAIVDHRLLAKDLENGDYDRCRSPVSIAMLHMLITASRTLIHTGTSPKTHMVRKTVRFNRQEVKTENPTIFSF